MKKVNNAIKKTTKMNKSTILILLLFPITVFSYNDDEIFVEPDDELIAMNKDFEDIDAAQRDNVFVFDPERWGIIQGTVSNQVAKENTQVLNHVIKRAAEFGITTLQIDAMNAYFEVNSRLNNPEVKSESAILIPSNFELKMSNNVFMRVQPNGAHTYSLIMVFEGENIKINGGNLIGDRWVHDYTPEVDLHGNVWGAHEWGHIIQIAGGKNVEIDNVNISDATGDGIVVNASVIRTDSNAVISENVTIKNCTINEIRRNALSLLDGDGIILDNCDVTNTGNGPENPQGVYNSNGAYPKYGISFEAFRGRDTNNNLIEYQRIENVEIKNCRFTGNYGGDINLYTSSNINIHDNYFDSMIANIASHDITIKDNIMEARLDDEGKYYAFGLLFKSRSDPFGEEMNYNYTITGNQIKNYINAMVLGGENYTVYNNTLTDFKAGVTFYKHLEGAQLYNNTLTSSVNSSSGYASLVASPTDVSVTNENITVRYRPINLSGLKADIVEYLTFDDCTFNSTDNKFNSISGSENITILNSQLNTQINIFNSTNIQQVNNNQ